MSTLLTCFLLFPFADDPTIAWKIESGTDFGAPIVVKDQLIVGDDEGRLQALDPSTGDRRWSCRLKDRVFQIRSDGDFVAAMICRFGVVVLKASNGEIVWTKRLDFEYGCCDIDGRKGRVLVAGNDGVLRCFDAANGEERWHSDFVANAPKVPSNLNGAMAKDDSERARTAGISFDERRVYLSVVDQMRVVAYDAENGDEKGCYLTEGWLWNAPLLVEGALVVASDDKRIHLVDRAALKRKWALNLGAPMYAKPLVDGEEVYCGTNNGTFHCADLRSGAEKWRFQSTPFKGVPSTIVGQPVVNEDDVFFASLDGRIFSLDRRNGTKRWDFQIARNRTIGSGMAKKDELVFATTRAEASLGQKGPSSLTAVRLPRK